MRAVVLAGGTGGAKLAAGMQELIGADLTVIANTGDDVETLGVHVSPDPDLITYWLCGEIDAERGWGIAGDSFTVFERLVRLGAPEWFGLGDRDLATCLHRGERLAAGERQSEVQPAIAEALGVRARVVPMCDAPVRTRVRTADGWRGLQEFLAREHGEPEVLELALDGIEAASPSPEAARALIFADAIVIGPSNPVISIGPILAVPGMRDAIRASRAPVVAVSPYVGGRILKGPTDALMSASGREASSRGVADAYAGVAAGLLVDSEDPWLPADEGEHAGLAVRAAPTLMDGAASRRQVAEAALDFARSLA